MNIHHVSHEGVAYILVKSLLVVVYRPVWSLVHEIIQETHEPRGKPVNLNGLLLALSHDSPGKRNRVSY